MGWPPCSLCRDRGPDRYIFWGWGGRFGGRSILEALAWGFVTPSDKRGLSCAWIVLPWGKADLRSPLRLLFGGFIGLFFTVYSFLIQSVLLSDGLRMVAGASLNELGCFRELLPQCPRGQPNHESQSE